MKIGLTIGTLVGFFFVLSGALGEVSTGFAVLQGQANERVGSMSMIYGVVLGVGVLCLLVVRAFESDATVNTRRVAAGLCILGVLMHFVQPFVFEWSFLSDAWKLVIVIAAIGPSVFALLIYFLLGRRQEPTVL